MTDAPVYRSLRKRNFRQTLDNQKRLPRLCRLLCSASTEKGGRGQTPESTIGPGPLQSATGDGTAKRAQAALAAETETPVPVRLSNCDVSGSSAFSPTPTPITSATSSRDSMSVRRCPHELTPLSAQQNTTRGRHCRRWRKVAWSMPATQPGPRNCQAVTRAGATVHPSGALGAVWPCGSRYTGRR